MNEMKIYGSIVAVALLIVSATSALAWTKVKEQDNYVWLRCRDGSTATMEEFYGAGWVISSPGSRGSDGGGSSYPSFEDAARMACGE